MILKSMRFVRSLRWGAIVLVLGSTHGLAPAGTKGTANVSAVVVSALPPDADIVDNFNDANDLDFWEGAMGAMEQVDGDGSIAHSFETVGAYEGTSLKLTYDLTQESEWNGYFINLNDSALITKNISSYQQISFWVKGSVGGVEHLKIGLENTSAEITLRNRVAVYVNDYHPDGKITSEWKKVSIPMAAFSGLDTLATAKTLTFVFEKSYVDPTLHPSLAQTGSVWIDDVRFSADALPEVRVDYFGDNLGLNALGGQWGSMGDAGVDAMISFAPAVAGSVPWTMLSEYNVNAVAWQGHYCLFGGGVTGWTAYPTNLSNYQYFKFRARVRSDTENPKTIKIEFDSTVRRVKNFTGLTSTFQTFSVDLVALSVDRSAIRQINIVYEKSRVTSFSGNKIGAVYFDNFEFSNMP
jgi:hypothetical protein